jgi:hypothetical protein
LYVKERLDCQGEKKGHPFGDVRPQIYIQWFIPKKKNKNKKIKKTAAGQVTSRGD